MPTYAPSAVPRAAPAVPTRPALPATTGPRGPYWAHNWKTYFRIQQELRVPTPRSPWQIYQEILENSGIGRMANLNLHAIAREIATGVRSGFEVCLSRPIQRAPRANGWGWGSQVQSCLNRLFIMIGTLNGQYKLSYRRVDDVLGYEFDVVVNYVEPTFPLPSGFTPSRAFGARTIDVGRVLIGPALPNWWSVLQGTSVPMKAVLLWDKNPHRPNLHMFAPHVSMGRELCMGTWATRVCKYFYNNPSESAFLLKELLSTYNIEGGPYIHAADLDPGSLVTEHRTWQRAQAAMGQSSVARYNREVVLASMHAVWSSDGSPAMQTDLARLDYGLWKRAVWAEIARRNTASGTTMRCRACGETGHSVAVGYNYDQGRLELRCRACDITACEICGAFITAGAFCCAHHHSVCRRCFYFPPYGRPPLDGDPAGETVFPTNGQSFEDYNDYRANHTPDKCWLCSRVHEMNDDDARAYVTELLGRDDEYRQPNGMWFTRGMSSPFWNLHFDGVCCWEPDLRIDDVSEGFCIRPLHRYIDAGWSCQTHSRICPACEDRYTSTNRAICDRCSEHDPDEEDDDDRDDDDRDEESEEDEPVLITPVAGAVHLTAEDAAILEEAARVLEEQRERARQEREAMEREEATRAMRQAIDNAVESYRRSQQTTG